MGKPLNSFIYDCEVIHERLHPKRHRFSYKLFFLDLDLDELPETQSRLKLFGNNRFNLFSLRKKDHLDLGRETIRENLNAWLAEQGQTLADNDRVRLLTLPAVLGHIFNPVCFYFVATAGGEQRFVVVEVCNTYREIKPWLITDQNGNGQFHLRVPKHFYVSPFTSLDTEFDFRIKIPNENVEIHIDDVEGDKTTLVSWIRGTRAPLTDRRLAWCAFRYPFLTVGVIFRIHWQALRLWLKRIPHHEKAANPELQKDLFRPHPRNNRET